MRTVFETSDHKKLMLHNNKLYTSHPAEILKALAEDILEVPELVIPLLEKIRKQGCLHKLAQYVWLSFESETGSVDSKLVMNGCYPLDELVEELKNIPAKDLIAQCPSWIKPVQVRLSAQDIFSSEVLWKRTIKVNKKKTGK